MSGERRVRYVEIHGEILAGLCMASPPGQWFRLDGGMPEDAKCVGIDYDFTRNMLRVAFEHPSFRAVMPGCTIERDHGPMMTALHGDDVCRDFEAGRLSAAGLREVLRADPEECRKHREKVLEELSAAPPGVAFVPVPGVGDLLGDSQYRVVRRGGADDADTPHTAEG